MGSIGAVPSVLTGDDFQDGEKALFKGRPNGREKIKTPPHQMRDFKFKDYAPKVFFSIRKLYNIDTADYMLTLAGNFQYLEFISNSKGGSFFFYTYDKKFMIKTISKEEAKFLRKILPAYYLHILKYPDTLINRFYGMHRVKPHAKDEFRFLVMGSVFYTNLPIHVVFDLKGSTLGRECSEKEKKTRELPILKDNDFTEMKQTINLGKTLADKFSAQIEADSKLLSELGIMDYSLLVGIHYRNKRPGRGRDSEAQDPASPEPPVDVSSPTKVAMTPEKQAPIASPVPDFSIDPPLEGTRSRTPSRKQREDESDEKSKSERELDKERLRRVSVHASKKYKAAATPHLSAPKVCRFVSTRVYYV